jgi:hypothetical protein
MAGSIVSVNGQIGLLSNRQLLAAAGSSFKVQSAASTAVVYSLAVGSSTTGNGLFAISNAAGSGKTVHLKRLTLTQTATAPTGTLAMHFPIYLESAIVALSGSFSADTVVNINPASGVASVATVTRFAASSATVPAAVGTRTLICEPVIQTGVAVIHDTYFVEFGNDEPLAGSGALTAARATAAARLGASAPAVVVEPGYSAIIQNYWLTAAANVPAYEYLFEWDEL